MRKRYSMIDKSFKGDRVISSVIVTGEAGNITNETVNSTYTEISPERQTLAQAAAEIQELLKQLEQTNPTATEGEKIAYVNDETTPSFKRRVIGALQAGGEVAIEEFFDNIYINIGKAIIKGWLKPE